MTRSAEAFGQEALQFIGDTDRATTTEAVAERMAGMVSRFGFEGLWSTPIKSSRSRARPAM